MRLAIDGSLTVGAIYRVAGVDFNSSDCSDCGEDRPGGFFIEGKVATLDCTAASFELGLLLPLAASANAPSR